MLSIENAIRISLIRLNTILFCIEIEEEILNKSIEAQIVKCSNLLTSILDCQKTLI